MPDVTTSYDTSPDFAAFYSMLTIIFVWSVLYSPNFHRLCIWLIQIFWFIDIPDVTVGYGRFSDSIVLYNSIHIWNVITSSNFHKLYIAIHNFEKKSKPIFLINFN